MVANETLSQPNRLPERVAQVAPALSCRAPVDSEVPGRYGLLPRPARGDSQHQQGEVVQVRAETPPLGQTRIALDAGFTITSYGESYNGQPLGCSGAGVYSSDTPDILAIGPARYEQWPCGTRLRVCGPVGCVDMIRVDSCPGCSATMLDTSESGYARACGEDSSGPCDVTVEEMP